MFRSALDWLQEVLQRDERKRPGQEIQLRTARVSTIFAWIHSSQQKNPVRWNQLVRFCRVISQTLANKPWLKCGPFLIRSPLPKNSFPLPISLTSSLINQEERPHSFHPYQPFLSPLSFSLSLPLFCLTLDVDFVSRFNPRREQQTSTALLLLFCMGAGFCLYGSLEQNSLLLRNRRMLHLCKSSKILYQLHNSFEHK